MFNKLASLRHLQTWPTYDCNHFLLPVCNLYHQPVLRRRDVRMLDDPVESKDSNNTIIIIQKFSPDFSEIIHY